MAAQIKVDNTDTNISYTGTWTSGSVAGFYNSTASWSNTSGNVVEYRFTGTSVKWYGSKNTDHGKVDIYVDGNLAASAIDTYASASLKQQVLYTKTGLANGYHMIQIVLRSDKNASSSGTFTDVDAFEVEDSAGTILREYWTGIAGTSVTAIPLSSNPTGTSSLTSFQAPSDWADNYGERIRGFLKPATSGNYTFYISGDDNSELWLSSNSIAVNKKKIAEVASGSSTNALEWTKYASQKSATIALTAGESYYIEVLHKEGTGTDHVAVGWTGPGISTTTVIAGSYLSPYMPVSTTAEIKVDDTGAGLRIREPG